MSEPTLFDMDPVPAAAEEPKPRLGTDASRTIRQAQAMANGRHPLALVHGAPLRLHPDAPQVGDRKAPGPRCGTCIFSGRNGWGYIKCSRGQSGEIGTPSFRRGPYETHGAATDIRAWWPACTFFEAPQPAEAATADEETGHCGWCPATGEMQSFDDQFFCDETCRDNYMADWAGAAS